MKNYILFLTDLFLYHAVSFAQKKVEDVLKNLDERSEAYGAIAQNMWEFAERGY